MNMMAKGTKMRETMNAKKQKNILTMTGLPFVSYKIYITIV